MFKSNYTIKDELKKKFQKNMEQIEAPTSAEINSEIEESNPGYSEKVKANKGIDIAKNAASITGGNYEEITSKSDLKSKYVKESNDDDTDDKSTGEKIAEGALTAAPGLLDMAGTIIASKGPRTSKERTATTMNLTAKGAALGMQVAGPWGAPVGAVVGLTAGLIAGNQSKKKLERQQALERVAYLNNTKDKRRKAQLLDDGKDAVEKSKNLLNAQMGMLNSKYS